MSTIRANAIVDVNGGLTTTINGVTPTIASQAQAQAGTDNTVLMTPLRVSQSITSLTPDPTSAQIGTATAGLTVGAVGSYIFAQPNNTTTYTTGSTIAGSLLLPIGAQSYDGAPATGRGAGTGSAQAGTWRCMGTRSTVSGVIDNVSTLWLRIL